MKFGGEMPGDNNFTMKFGGEMPVDDGDDESNICAPVVTRAKSASGRVRVCVCVCVCVCV